jgi:hypothetical protein
MRNKINLQTFIFNQYITKDNVTLSRWLVVPTMRERGGPRCIPHSTGRAHLSMLVASALAGKHCTRPNHETDSKHAQIDDYE